jgi:hypothetical protein
MYWSNDTGRAGAEFYFDAAGAVSSGGRPLVDFVREYSTEILGDVDLGALAQPVRKLAFFVMGDSTVIDRWRSFFARYRETLIVGRLSLAQAVERYPQYAIEKGHLPLLLLRGPRGFSVFRRMKLNTRYPLRMVRLAIEGKYPHEPFLIREARARKERPPRPWSKRTFVWTITLSAVVMSTTAFLTLKRASDCINSLEKYKPVL